MGGIALVASFFLQIWREKRAPDHPTPIVKIVQKQEGAFALPALFLEQLLGLSQDHPSDFYLWDEKLASEKLNSFPIFSKVYVKKAWPQTVVVSYLLKQPIALLYDYENVAIDDKGSLLPLIPFLHYEKLPQLYLDLPPFGQEDPISHRKGGDWENPLCGKQIELALHLLSLFSPKAVEGAFTVEWIDLSKIFSESYGKREIVVFTKTALKIDENFVAIFPHILRLSPIHYAQQLGNYLSLQKKMMKDYRKQLKKNSYAQQEIRFRPKMIDLRLDSLAFINGKATDETEDW